MRTMHTSNHCISSNRNQRLFSSPRNTSRILATLALFLAAVSSLSQPGWAQEEFSAWNLETNVGQAHLIMVARVASISRLTIVEGAKTDLAFREYRFQPVKRLKGIFQRDVLSMTAADLGCPADNAASCPLQEGEYRLLILVQRQGLRSYGCAAPASGATTFAERVPLLTGAEDPLVGAVETLIQVADARSRRDKATLLVERLIPTEGLAAVPLLTSLQLRADWGAGEPRAYPVLARLAGSPLTVVRGAAINVLRRMLASRQTPSEPAALDDAARALRTLLESDEPTTSIRLAALDALDDLLTLQADADWIRPLLITQSSNAATHAERGAAVSALARIAHPEAMQAVLAALATLPLDEPPARERIYVDAAIRADRGRAEQILLARFGKSLAARQPLDAEIWSFCQIKSEESLPLLLTAAAKVNLPPVEGQLIATALGQLKDDRAVPVLINWTRNDTAGIKPFALTALEQIDSQLVANSVRPLLKTEGLLPFKLRIARLLARHGIDDGYALATEQLADDGQTASAALVLAALDDPRTKQELSAIVAAPPDRRWHAAALVGLVAIGDANAEQQLLKILGDDRNPLTVAGSEAAGLSTNPNLLAPLATLIKSRNEQLAMTALIAVGRYLTDVRSTPLGLTAATLPDAGDVEPRNLAANLPDDTRAALAQSVQAIVLDTYVNSQIRQQALKVAGMLGGDGYAKLLTDLADQAELEGTPLLSDVQAAHAAWRQTVQKVAQSR